MTTDHVGEVGRGAVRDVEERRTGEPGGDWVHCLTLPARVDTELVQGVVTGGELAAHGQQVLWCGDRLALGLGVVGETVEGGPQLLVGFLLRSQAQNVQTVRPVSIVTTVLGAPNLNRK